MRSIKKQEMNNPVSTTCPICSEKVGVNVFNMMIWGKTAAIASAREKASAMHYSISSGYMKCVNHI